MTRTIYSAARDKAELAAAELIKLGDSVEAEFELLELAKKTSRDEMAVKLSQLEETKLCAQEEIEAKLQALEASKIMAQEELRKEIEQQRRVFDEEIKSEKSALEEKEQSLEREMARMNTLGEGTHDLVHINVGGDLVTVKRSTLCQHKGSVLANMFSGRWEQKLDRDDDGRVYFDFNPKHFHVILNHLRHTAFSKCYGNRPFLLSSVPLPRAAFWDLVRFLGLETAFAECDHVEVKKGQEIKCARLKGDQCNSSTALATADRDVFVHFICSACKTMPLFLRSCSKTPQVSKCLGGCGYEMALKTTCSKAEIVCKDCHDRHCPTLKTSPYS